MASVAVHFDEMRRNLARRLSELRDANAALADRSARLVTLQADLMQRDPRRAAENASSLLLIGYLIRSFEEDLEGRQIAANSPELH